MAAESRAHELLRRAHALLACGELIFGGQRALGEGEAARMQREIGEWLRENEPSGGTAPGDWKGDAQRDQGPPMEPEYL
jgi:hypothetical protein